MLTLDLPAEPYWLVLPRGVRVEIRPVTTAVMAAAQAASIARDCGDSCPHPNAVAIGAGHRPHRWRRH